MKKLLGLVAIVLVWEASPSWASTDITAYTIVGSTNGSGEYHDGSAAVSSITADGVVVTNLIGPTAASITESPVYVYAGQAGGKPADSPTNEKEFVLGNVPTRGWAGGSHNGVVDLFFDRTIVDGSGYEIFALELGGGDEITLEAITGGTPDSPELSNLPLTVTTSKLKGSGLPKVAVNVAIDKVGGAENTFALGGAAFDLVDDLGVSELIGVRYSTNDGADIATVLVKVGPESSSSTLILIGCVAGMIVVMRRREA